MNNSLVPKYFDFSQALEFLKQGIAVSNTSYNDGFRFEKFEEGEDIIPAGIYLHNAECYYDGWWDLNGNEAIIDDIDSFSLEDVLNEEWFIYEEKD